jgi:predicted anti-sigma-YlaC factor YlaD
VIVCLLATLLLPACSIQRMALNGLADALAGGGSSVFASDPDPELIRDAVPFSLKSMEALLVELPEHEGLLLAACSGFTQYAYAYPQTDAALVEARGYAEAEALRARALGLYLRGRDYCLRALELRHPGVGARLLRESETALEGATRLDVPFLYWTGASWGVAISLGLDRTELVADLPAVRALLARALALEEDWNAGAIHAVLISLEAVPPAMGGSPERARAHFERAVELSGGASAAPYVSYATSVARPAGDRAEFERLLGEALAIDPDVAPEQRLANLVAQRHARHLLGQADRLFVEEPSVGRSP